MKKIEEKLRLLEDRNKEEMKNVWKNNYLDAMSKLNKEMNKTKLIVSLFFKIIYIINKKLNKEMNKTKLIVSLFFNIIHITNKKLNKEMNKTKLIVSLFIKINKL